MKTPSFRIYSALLLSGALTATISGISCTAEDELEDLEDLEAIEDEERGGGGHHDDGYDDGHHDECHDDHEAPRFETKKLTLWPPNHRLVEIDLADCLEEVHDCDDHPRGKILWVSSDEPVNGHGDGNTWPDIVCVDHDTVKLRAERKGPGDGRVYKVKFELKDHHDNKSYGICEVIVPHDPHHGATDSGESYRKHC